MEPLHLGDSSYTDDRAPHFASLVIGMLAFSLCWRLHFAETWTILSRQMRTFLGSYNMAIVVIIVTALRCVQATYCFKMLMRLNLCMSTVFYRVSTWTASSACTSVPLGIGNHRWTVLGSSIL